jgi:transmembrane sensor
MAASLERLGEHIASALEEAAPERTHAIEAARRNFLQYERTLSTRTSFANQRRVGASAAAIAVLAAASILVFSRHHAPITFAVDGAAGTAKHWLAAPESAPLLLEFSEGTKIRLAAAARATVTELDARGADLALEGGSLHAEVVHQRDSAWKVDAGPFTVSVTGTVFDVSWEPNSQELVVSVSRGSVSVRDSNSGGEQAVHASETLHTTAATHLLQLSRSEAANAPPVESAAGPAPIAAGAPEVTDNSAEPAAANAHDTALNAADDTELAPAKSDSGASEWRTLAKRGALREAFASAESAGFSRTCASASPTELLLLGDGARLSGKPDRATEALLTLRRRYPGDSRRAAAAFALGKVAFDQRGAFEQAAEWFSTSLREQPGGPLAREASGRLIEALRRADDSAGARRAARDYLDKYPEGPHADLARSVLR